MVNVHFSNIMLTSIENLTHINNSNGNLSNNSVSNTNTIKLPHSCGSENGGNGKAAKAVLICHPNSHSFADRTLILDKPVKIGRSVGHNKTSTSNAIFDCKVLSRNHALLWFEEGKFLLKDTRSSNGTFVNTERLSKSGEESVTREVFSGDTVQFGVDVVENSRNVTHGCVIATLKLFLASGKEAKPLPAVFSCGDRNKVTLEDLYHLNQYLQESLQREQMLEAKLRSLQSLMKTLRDSTELSWKALISNNSLLSRVELLEVQLKCYSNKFAEDQLREELRVLQEDKNAYEGVVKEYFQKIVDQKLEAVQQCQDLDRTLDNTKTEFSNAQLLLANCQNELRKLALKNTSQEKTIEELEVKLHMADEKAKESAQKLLDENALLYGQIKSHAKTEEVLQQTIRELETHGDYAHKQVMSLQSQVEELQKHHSDILCELVDPTVIKDKIKDVELVKSWIAIYVEAARKCQQSTVAVRERVEQLRGEKSAKQQKIGLLECELMKCVIELQDYKGEQLELETKITERKSELELSASVPDIMDELNEKKCGGGENDALDLQEKKKLLNVIQRDVKLADEHFKELELLLKSAKDEMTQLTVAYAVEEDKLDLSEKQLANLENAVRTLQEHVHNLDTYHQNEKVCIEDVQSLKKQLSEAHEVAQEKQNVTIRLVKYFAEFTELVNRKLNQIDEAIIQRMPSSESHHQQQQQGEEEEEEEEELLPAVNVVEELNALKLESGRLADAVSQLQNDASDQQLSPPDDCPKLPLLRPLRKDDEVDTSFSTNPADNFDEMVVLKERVRCLTTGNKELEMQLLKLQQQYDYLKSYPYFDMYFILPVILLICVCIFNFGDKLSFIFGTWD